LSVGALVFIAITAHDLKIFFYAANHENLFELLRRLRQGIEVAGILPARHEEFARAFRRGLEERRRLHFQKALLIEKNARRIRGLVAETEVARHFGPAQ